MKEGLEAERPASSRCGGQSERRAYGEPESGFTAEGGRWRGHPSAHGHCSQEPRRVGPQRIPTLGPRGHSVLPEHSPRPAKGHGSQFCQPVPSVAEDLTAHRHLGGKLKPQEV